jgi:hypothetical protein
VHVVTRLPRYFQAASLVVAKKIGNRRRILTLSGSRTYHQD